MNLSPMEDLHQIVFKTLSVDTQFNTLLGGAKVFDRLPDRTKPPYVVMGEITATDWSTATEPGEVLTFTIHTWSRAADREISHTVMDRIKALLIAETLDLTDHHLVNLRCQFSEIRREVSSNLLHGILRFRAVTEPRT